MENREKRPREKRPPPREPLEELMDHIRLLENKLHAIENAVDGPRVCTFAAEDIIELIKSYLPWDDENADGGSWLIEPRCPECGWCLHACSSGDPGCMHCDNPDCSYTKEPS